MIRRLLLVGAAVLFLLAACQPAAPPLAQRLAEAKEHVGFELVLPRSLPEGVAHEPLVYLERHATSNRPFVDLIYLRYPRSSASGPLIKDYIWISEWKLVGLSPLTVRLPKDKRVIRGREVSFVCTRAECGAQWVDSGIVFSVGTDLGEEAALLVIESLMR